MKNLNLKKLEDDGGNVDQQDLPDNIVVSIWEFRRMVRDGEYCPDDGDAVYVGMDNKEICCCWGTKTPSNAAAVVLYPK